MKRMIAGIVLVAGCFLLSATIYTLVGLQSDFGYSGLEVNPYAIQGLSMIVWVGVILITWGYFGRRRAIKRRGG